MRRGEVRIEVDGLMQLIESFFEATDFAQNVADHSVDNKRKRIELVGALDFDESFVKPPFAFQTLAEPLVCRCIVWI